MDRENAGFKIVASVPIAKNLEVVIGFKETSLGDQYVCWFCKDLYDYYWGRYTKTYLDALCMLVNRLNDYYPGALK